MRNYKTNKKGAQAVVIKSHPLRALLLIQPHVLHNDARLYLMRMRVQLVLFSTAVEHYGTF